MAQSKAKICLSCSFGTFFDRYTTVLQGRCHLLPDSSHSPPEKQVDDLVRIQTLSVFFFVIWKAYREINNVNPAIEFRYNYNINVHI